MKGCSKSQYSPAKEVSISLPSLRWTWDELGCRICEHEAIGGGAAGDRLGLDSVIRRSGEGADEHDRFAWLAGGQQGQQVEHADDEDVGLVVCERMFTPSSQVIKSQSSRLARYSTAAGSHWHEPKRRRLMASTPRRRAVTAT